ncbi:MAG TPA: F0F1 ATP synthase subunit delta [Marmoricola sp.]|nr:F0F1 ATP synthase subunit delta [Marmoricola sp.]
MADSFRGASAESQELLYEQLGTAVNGGADGNRIGDDLFGVAQLLESEPRLRRILTDVSTDAEAKAGLVRQLFGGKLADASVELVSLAARQRWAGTRDLGFALERVGVVAVVRAAEQEGHADALEEELFAFGRLVSENHELRDALSDPARSDDDKRALLESLLAGRVTSGTMRLAQQATSGSHRTVAVAIEEYEKVAAAQRQRLVALVHVAQPLGEGETERLRAALARQYGREVHLNVLVDPGVIGGVRVEVGNDVIDGTVASRLDEARRRLAG